MQLELTRGNLLIALPRIFERILGLGLPQERVPTAARRNTIQPVSLRSYAPTLRISNQIAWDAANSATRANLAADATRNFSEHQHCIALHERSKPLSLKGGCKVCLFFKVELRFLFR